MDKEQVLRIVEDMRLHDISFLDLMVSKEQMSNKVATQHKRRHSQLVKYLEKNLK